MKSIFGGILLTATLMSCVLQGTTLSQVREIPVRFLPGIARVQNTSRGPLIYYNPAACRRVGPEVCAFVRAHEYAHISLNHLNRNIPVRQAEFEADTLAAQMVSPSTAAAAQRWFRRGHGGSLSHGSAWQRARRVGHFSANRPSYPNRSNSPTQRTIARLASTNPRSMPSQVGRRFFRPGQVTAQQNFRFAHSTHPPNLPVIIFRQ